MLLAWKWWTKSPGGGGQYDLSFSLDGGFLFLKKNSCDVGVLVFDYAAKELIHLKLRDPGPGVQVEAKRVVVLSCRHSSRV